MFWESLKLNWILVCSRTHTSKHFISFHLTLPTVEDTESAQIYMWHTRTITIKPVEEDEVNSANAREIFFPQIRSVFYVFGNPVGVAQYTRKFSTGVTVSCEREIRIVIYLTSEVGFALSFGYCRGRRR